MSLSLGKATLWSGRRTAVQIVAEAELSTASRRTSSKCPDSLLGQTMNLLEQHAELRLELRVLGRKNPQSHLLIFDARGGCRRGAVDELDPRLLVSAPNQSGAREYPFLRNCDLELIGQRNRFCDAEQRAFGRQLKDRAFRRDGSVAIRDARVKERTLPNYGPVSIVHHRFLREKRLAQRAGCTGTLAKLQEVH